MIKRNIKKILCFFVFLVFPINAYAASIGETSLAFLDLPTGAKYIAMGATGTGLAEDSNAMHWNPGLLAKTAYHSLELMHSVYLEDMFYDFASLSLMLSSKSTIGLSVKYFNYGEMKSFDNAGYYLGTMDSYDICAAFGYAIDIKDFGIGVSAKFIQSKIENTANAYAFDLGVSTPYMIDDKLLIGLMINNIGNGIKYDQQKEELPMTIRAGASFYINDECVIAADIALPKDSDFYIAAGAEYKFIINEEARLSFRGGYNTMSDIKEDLSGITLGIGYSYRNIEIDYAFAPMGFLGNTHRISLTYFWS